MVVPLSSSELLIYPVDTSSPQRTYSLNTIEDNEAHSVALDELLPSTDTTYAMLNQARRRSKSPTKTGSSDKADNASKNGIWSTINIAKKSFQQASGATLHFVVTTESPASSDAKMLARQQQPHKQQQQKRRQSPKPQPLAQPVILIPDDLPGRADISLLPNNALLSEFCESVPCLLPRTSYSQPDCLSVQFPEDFHPVQATKQYVSLPCSPFSSFEPEVSESIVYEPPVHKAPTDLKELNLPEASYPMNCDNRETDVTLAYLPSKRDASGYLPLKPSVIETQSPAMDKESPKQATQDSQEDELLKEEIPVDKVLAESVQEVLHQEPKRRNSNSPMVTDICIEFKHVLKQVETIDMGTTHQNQSGEYIPKFSIDMPSMLQVIFDKLASDVVTHDSPGTKLPVSSVRPSVQISSAGDIGETNIRDVKIMPYDAEDTSVSRTPVLTASNSHDTSTHVFPSPLFVSSLPMSEDDMSAKTIPKIPVPMPEDDTDHCDAELYTQRQLMHLHYEPDLPSFTSSQSFGRIKHVSTPASDSQVQTPATKYVVLSAIPLPQGAPETNHSRAPDKIRLQAEGISNQPSCTEIGLCAHQPPNLLNDLRVGLFSATLQRHHGECSTCETLGIG